MYNYSASHDHDHQLVRSINRQCRQLSRIVLICKFIINGLIVDIKLETNDSRVENLHGWHGVMRCSYMLQKETYKSARDAKMIRHQLFFSEPQELKRLFQYGTKQQHSEYQSGTSSAKACILCIFSQLIYLIYMTMNAIPE